MAEIRTEKPRVLHVDDDEDVRAIAMIALAVVGGLEVLQCAGGHEALTAVRDFKPDLFLLDWMMPEMTGEETLAELQLIPGMKSIPVIFLTARAQAQDIAHLMELGAAKVITKPFNPITLASEVIDVWSGMPQTS